jgi:CubicO group peptidase (beta-lactamase class C family)
LNIDIPALDAFLERKRRALRQPGLAVAVVSNGRIIYLRGLGAAAPGRVMTPQTPFIVGSLSKSFTALAALQLVEAGKLELDAPVVQYIPWFCLADAAASASITIKHLLTHTSGISRFAGRVLLAGRGGKTIEQSVRDLRGLRLSQPVGVAFQYSNINYSIAGLVIEVVSGQPFSTYVEQHILTPLQMKHSYTCEEAARRGGLASGYRWWFGVPLPYRAPYLDDALPAAFLAASAEDMARYALALLGDGSPVLSPAGVAELHRPRVAAPGPGSSYALGWRVESLGGVPVVRHGGEVSNYLAEMVLAPGRRLGVVVLMNVSNGLPVQVGLPGRVASSVTRYLLGIPQPRRRLSFTGFYTLLDVALALLSVYQIWSLAAMLRSGSARLRSALGLAALCEVGLAVAAARRIPRWADSPWGLLRVYVPDLTSWLAAFFCGSLVKCLVLLVRLLRHR